MIKKFEWLPRPESFQTLAPIPSQAKPLPNYPRLRPPVSSIPSESDDWDRALLAVRKHWRLAALFAAAVVITVIIVTFLMKPVYEPEAKIEIDPPGAEIFSLQGASLGSTDAAYLETQAQELQSDELAVSVIRHLHLGRNPESVGNAQADRSPKAASEADADLSRLTPEENAALRAFRSSLKVRRDTASRIVIVQFASHSPQLAADVVNALLNLFVEDTYRTRHEVITQSTQWLSRQLEDIRKKMDDSNQALAEFQRKTGIVDVDANKNSFAEQMGELDRQLALAQGERIQYEAFLNRAKKSSSDSLPQVHNNLVIQSLTQKLAEVQGELSQAQVIYGNNHPNVKKLLNQANELQSQLNAQRNSIVGELETNYAAARSREELLSSQIKGAAKQLNTIAQYNSLKKEAQTNTDLYNNLYAKIKEAGITAASKSSNVRIVDRARVLDSPTRPHRFRNIAAALFAGLFGGLVIVFVKERVQNRIDTPEDIRRWTGISSISLIPTFQVRPVLPQKGHPQLSKNGTGTCAADKFLLSRPNSPEAEALRALYTSVMLSKPDNPPRTILIASPFQGEGKTTVATNLAIALSQRGRTCLVDADLRRPGVASAFGLSEKGGLRDVLLGSSTLDEVLVPNLNLPNLTILPAGAATPDAGLLTCSEGMRNVIQILGESFEFVVVDSPPILPYSDGRAISPLVDGVILVGRSRATTRQALVRSMELLAEVHSAPVLDIVLNAAGFGYSDYGY